MPAFANIVYTINQSSTVPEVVGELSPLSDTVSGTITTNGTIGYLSSSDIVDYNLLLTDNYRPEYDIDLTPADSSIVQDTGNGLLASATTLAFNFSNSGAVFLVQVNAYSGAQYLCFQAMNGPCVAGETIVPDYYSVDGVVATGLSGAVPLNGVPEPATWGLMLLGAGGIGTVMRSRRRVTAAPA